MSNTPLVKTMRRPSARASCTNDWSAAASRTRATRILELYVRRKPPRVARTIDADVLDRRFDTERGQRGGVMVGVPVTFVKGAALFVGPPPRVEPLDGK